MIITVRTKKGHMIRCRTSLLYVFALKGFADIVNFGEDIDRLIHTTFAFPAVVLHLL